MVPSITHAELKHLLSTCVKVRGDDVCQWWVNCNVPGQSTFAFRAQALEWSAGDQDCWNITLSSRGHAYQVWKEKTQRSYGKGG